MLSPVIRHGIQCVIISHGNDLISPSTQVPIAVTEATKTLREVVQDQDNTMTIEAVAAQLAVPGAQDVVAVRL